MKTTFTAEQEAALSLEHHCIVSAAAGSGKTRVLVERYVRMLMQGVDPRSIVAITFTRKAAAEMLSRVSKRIEEILDDQSCPEGIREQLLRAQSRLGSARISTIHSFCSSLLREYPIEAGVSPDFRELGSGEAERLRSAAIQRVLEQRLESAEHSLACRALIAALGQRTLTQILDQLARNQEQVLELQDFYQRESDEQIVERSQQLVISALQQSVHEFIGCVHELLSLMDASTRTKNEELLTTFDLLEKTLATFESSMPALMQAYEATMKSILGAKGGVVASVKKSFEKLSETTQDQLKARNKSLKELRDLVDASAYDAQSVALARQVHELSIDVLQEMQEEKDEQGILDFDDLQLRCRQLLRDDTVCRQVRQNIPYLMMDEFQDTNALQYELASLLVRSLKHSDITEAKPNIFIVGDAKQSIYGFRRADVRVFDEAKTDILNANQRRLVMVSSVSDAVLVQDKGPSDDGSSVNQSDTSFSGDVHLSTSFRMAPALVAFVNRICCKVMSERSSAYDVEYEDMICGRSIQSCSPSHIEILIGQKQTTSSEATDQGVVREAALVAERLHALLHSTDGIEVWDDHTKSRRRLELRDIAILARSGTKIPLLMHELLKRNLPCIRHSGRGFYDTVEVQDVLSILHLVNNPSDDAALAAVLRSPYFGLDDSQLLWLCNRKHPEASLWEHLRGLDQSSCKDVRNASLVLRARAIIAELLPQVSYSSATQILRLFLRECAWHAAIQYSERADQSIANVEKCIDVIRRHELSGFRHIHDVVEELERLAAADDAEAEAAVIGDQNAINVMTIHASKGLEFPLVAIYDMSFRGNHSNQLCMNEHFGLSFKVPDQLGRKRSSHIRDVSLEHEKQKDLAEEKRLLYVGLTRARDHLLLSMEVDSIKEGQLFSDLKGGGFLPLLQKGLQHSFSLSQNTTMTLALGYQRLDNSVLHQSEVEQNIVVSVRSERVEPDRAQIQPSNIVSRPLLLDALQTTQSDESFSASHAMTYATDAQEYFRIYQLGLAAQDEQHFQSKRMRSEDDDDRISGSRSGIIIHAALARLQEWLDPKSGIQQSALQSCLDEIFYAEQLSAHEVLRERVQADIQRLCSMPIVQENAAALAAAWQEYSLSMPLGDDFLSGTLDLLLVNSNGECEVWDWKTNRLERQNEDDWFDHYRLQLHVYCLLLSYQFPEQKQFIARLLFSRGGTQRVLELNREQLMLFEKDLLRMIGEMKRSQPHEWHSRIH